jgi:GTP-sensing pleiotropic transcriptional regulator CodY
MITGYQRQHRKSIMYQNIDGGDAQTTDQYTKLITSVANRGAIHEQFSKACELAAVSGMVMLQPYLDYNGDDNAQGQLKLKIWEYNAFLVDPYFREPDMSDAQFIWCQEYISKKEAEERFPDKLENIAPMAGTPQRYGSFYFLPENYNMARNDLMVLSYVWYKWKTKKKRLYSDKRKQFFDFAGGDEQIAQIMQAIPDLEEVTVEVPCWKLAVVLNEQLMFQGDNPIGDIGCPMIPVFWNYEPHINYYDLRVRSLIRTMRDPQFLFNYKVITNNDIVSATINAGWKRKVGAVANEDNLKKSGQGWDVIINEGYDMTDCEKLIPSAVPQSDLELAQQMDDLIWKTAGINLENWAGQNDKQISTLTQMMKMAANLLVFQKYFDQWDYSLKLVGEKMLNITLNNWNVEKVGQMIGEEPSPFFFSRIFSKFSTIVEEADLTPTQQNLQAQQMLEINERFGREVFPPSKIIPKLNITGKGEIIPWLEQQEQQMQAVQSEETNIKHAYEDAKLRELYSKAAANIAKAREDHSRSESNLGLYEERLSMIERNRAMSLKEKQNALQIMLENMHRFGELEMQEKERQLDEENTNQMLEEEFEKRDVEKRTGANKFLAEIMSTGMQSQQQQQMQQPEGAGQGIAM